MHMETASRGGLRKVPGVHRATVANPSAKAPRHRVRFATHEGFRLVLTSLRGQGVCFCPIQRIRVARRREGHRTVRPWQARCNAVICANFGFRRARLLSPSCDHHVLLSADELDNEPVVGLHPTHGVQPQVLRINAGM